MFDASMVLPGAVHRACYKWTNESLPAIVAGMEPGPRDSILAVGGSGDQAFALLEKAGDVTVVDRCPDHLAHIKLRKRLLLEGDEEGFLCPPGAEDYFPPERERTRAYFMEGNRLCAIRERLGSLTVVETATDVFADVLTMHPHKVYISNALPTTDLWHEKELPFDRLACKILPGGLLYAVVSDVRPGDSYKPVGMVVDQQLTGAARALDVTAWVPTVYRKCAA